MKISTIGLIIQTILFSFSLGISLARHGKVCEGTESFWISLLSTIILETLILMIYGIWD